MQFNSSDPLDWTVDEVVAYLCHNPETPWSRSNSTVPRPPASFEASLRENLITGEVLLQDVGKEALRDDLGLKALGHRSSIMSAIRYLQRLSPKYQASISEQTVKMLPLSPVHPQPPLRTSAQSPTAQHSTPLPTVGPNTPALAKPVTTFVTSDSSVTGGVRDNVNNARQNSSRFDLPIPGLSQDLLQESCGRIQHIHPRYNEQIVVDKHGNKRRKLDLCLPVEPRIDNSIPKRSGDSEVQSWYMGPDGVTVEQIFYDPEFEDDGQTFTLISPRLPTAQRTFVNNRLKYFFQQSPIKLNTNGRSSYQAIIPYKPSMVKFSKDRHFTLYTTRQGRVNATKGKLDEWPQLKSRLEVDKNARPRSESLGPSDSFSYLLQKYPVEEGLEHALPIYGDSGSEGEFDEETWQEIYEEAGEPMLPQCINLGPAEVDSVIRDCVSQFETKWRETYQAKEKYKARKLWLAARKRNSINQEVKALAKDTGLLELRLHKLSNEISRNEYSTQTELRTQCQCLEQTVFEIQKQKWRSSMLTQEKCPDKVSAPPKRRYLPKTVVGGDESLHSESSIDEDNSHDEFVVDDTDGAPGIIQGQFVENLPASLSPSGTDDDIISVSGKRCRTRGQVPKVFESSSRSPSPSAPHPRQVQEKPEVIDLTEETPEPDDFIIKTPPLNPVATPKSSNTIIPGVSASMSPPPSFGSAESSVQVKTERGPSLSMPDINDMNGIMSLEWRLIEERKDRRRLLAKLVCSLSDEERNLMAEKVPNYPLLSLKTHTHRALECLIKGSRDVEGIGASMSHLVMRTSSFYISWLHCARHDLQGIKKRSVQAALEKFEDNKNGGFDTYYSELVKRLECWQAWQRDTEADADRDLGPEDTPHKKRKRAVQESQSAKLHQASAQQRMRWQEKQRKRLEKRLQSMGVSNYSPGRHAVSFKKPIIYLHPHIGQHVKLHQLSGIQFMWRELVEDKNKEGCLLAHTMGLGKTMQVISLLVTITAAANSPDPRIQQQVPEDFRPRKDLPEARTLVICPSSLIENWRDEFVMWTPEDVLLTVRQVSSEDNMDVRLAEVSTWYEKGGVLLISYDIFRNWVLNQATAKKSPPLSDSRHQDVKHWLLEGPSIIIADEAHKMKNPDSATSQAAMQFRSKSRIALTGSPLANNLGDYYTMVNWISYDYLGSFLEFKANYIEPIKEGLYADSTYGEKRKSLMKLQVLKQILEPKINRAAITVLEGDLPPKVEFVLTVPLTKIQKEAYDAYAAFILQGRIDEVTQAQLWSWLSILGLCCNHPACFRDKLVSQAQGPSKKTNDIRKTDDVDQSVSPDRLGDEFIENAGIRNLEELVAEQLRLFANVHDLKAVELSVRTVITKRIIDESIRAGDKVLVFSQSLHTLDYLEHLLKVTNRQYSRLDGQTPAATRQAATKKFNQGKKQVYLISTRAGGLGLNITGANRVIIFDFSFSPIWEEQAVGRAYRLGQRKPVFVYRFIAGGTFQEIIYEKATYKTQLAVRVVDKRNPIRSAHKKPGDYLFPARPVAQQDISEHFGKDKDVLDKILREDEKKGAEYKLIRDIKLTQTFLVEDDDKLTEDEKRTVQEAFDDETLRRTDPAAYAKRVAERQLKQMQEPYRAQPASPIPVSVGPNAYQSQMLQNPPNGVPPTAGINHAARQSIQPAVPQSAHNTGPPALAPDIISAHVAVADPILGRASPFLANVQVSGLCIPAPDEDNLVKGQEKPQTLSQPSHSQSPNGQVQKVNALSWLPQKNHLPLKRHTSQRRL
ncbi:P-loop containing nucleoside triphosphate hydrolase protein [Aspergillus nidulans var. acristatus]